MSTEFILFIIMMGIVLLYPLFSFIASRRLTALKTRLAAEQCPKCREVFGLSIVRTARELEGFIDPTPAGPLLRIVCPHCALTWDYCDGFYTQSPMSNDVS